MLPAHLSLYQAPTQVSLQWSAVISNRLQDNDANCRVGIPPQTLARVTAGGNNRLSEGAHNLFYTPEPFVVPLKTFRSWGPTWGQRSMYAVIVPPLGSGGQFCNLFSS
jgi:hypothetical protein